MGVEVLSCFFFLMMCAGGKCKGGVNFVVVVNSASQPSPQQHQAHNMAGFQLQLSSTTKSVGFLNLFSIVISVFYVPLAFESS